MIEAVRPAFKRILLKLSGEALMGDMDYGIDPAYIRQMALDVKAVSDIGVEVAMVIGGVGNLRGAMIGGLMIGIIEIMNDAYFTASYRDMIVFGLFFVFIVFKPEGLFGTREKQS